MSIEKAKTGPLSEKVFVEDVDINEAYDKLQETMERNPNHSLRDFRPDDSISPDQERTPDEESAARDFERIDRAATRAGIDIQTKRVLEVGSGMGEMLRVLKKNNINAVGIDVNPREYASMSKNEAGIINAPLEALKAEKIGQFGVIFGKDFFDNDRYGFQVYKDMLQTIDSLLESGGVFVRMGTGRFLDTDVPDGWKTIYDLPQELGIYQKG